MDQQFWTELATMSGAVVVSMGAIGGVFWVLLQKGLDAKFAQLLEGQKAELAAQLHVQNTVYSRVDEQRSDAVQKINALIRRHRWKWVEFSPKVSFKVGAERQDPFLESLTWCLSVQQQANEVLQTVNDLSMLLPDEFTLKVVAGWYYQANGLATEMMPIFMQLRATAGYQAATEMDQRKMLLEAKDRALPQHQEALQRVTNSIIEDLRQLFTATGGGFESAPIAPSQFPDTSLNAVRPA